MPGKPGHAAWKFMYPNGKIIYKRSNRSALDLFMNNAQWGDPCAIYYRSKQGGWEFAANLEINDRCQCGREYTNTFNGREFRFRDMMFKSIKTIKECVDLFNQPELCQICFYTLELKAGRFCPRWVKEQLNNNSSL